MAKKKETADKEVKREVTAEEWRAISVLYLKGETAANICKMYDKCHINVKMVKRRMKNVTLMKEEIDEKAKEQIISDMVDDKVQFTKRIVNLYNGTLDVISNIVQEYKDEDFLKPAKRHATAYNLDQLSSALNKCQNGIRTALGMDKEGNLEVKEPEIITIKGMDMDKI